MGFLIDTNLWIAVERGRLSAADIHAITQQLECFAMSFNDWLEKPPPGWRESTEDSEGLPF